MASKTIWVKGRLAFADGIFEKKGIAGDASSTPRYNCGVIIAGDDDAQLELIRATEEEVATEHQWKSKEKGADVLKTLRKKDRAALHDGDDKQKYEGFPGNFYLSPSNDSRPTAVDRDRSPLTKDDGKLYSGCYVNAKVEIWAQDNNFGQRINATLLGVQFVKDGDAFGAGAPPANPDDFPDLDAEGDDDDSLFV